MTSLSPKQLLRTLSRFSLVAHHPSPSSSPQVCKLSSAARTFTRADGHVCRLHLPDPVALLPGRLYMVTAVIRGSEGYCCEDCLETVMAGGIKISFHCWWVGLGG
jgi:hypothetical protein